MADCMLNMQAAPGIQPGDVEDIKELFKLGKITNPAERQLLAEEKAGKVLPPAMMTRPYT